MTSGPRPEKWKMAVRLRKINGVWFALCAAEYPHQPGIEEIYLDDAQDHALRIKYLEDFKSEGLIKED